MSRMNVSRPSVVAGTMLAAVALLGAAARTQVVPSAGASPSRNVPATVPTHTSDTPSSHPATAKPPATKVGVSATTAPAAPNAGTVRRPARHGPARTVRCCHELAVGTDVAPGTYHAVGTDCIFHLHGPDAVDLAIPYEPGAQALLELRRGDRVMVTCTFLPGAGEDGDHRSYGVQTNLRAGRWVTDRPCIALFSGQGLARGAAGEYIAPSADHSFTLSGGTVKVPADCGGITRSD